MAHLHRFANPNRFLKISRTILPWSNLFAGALLIAGLYFALFNSPADAEMNQNVRIMYVHVPSAWVAVACYSLIALASFVALVWRHPLAHVTAHAAAPIGLAFTMIVIATGMLWGQATWGKPWVWDLRLTSVAILAFLYLGHIALTHAFDNRQRGANAAAILALVGAVNIPIIRGSVKWFNEQSTVHQTASVTRLGSPAIDASMLTPLLLMALAFTAIFVSLLLLRIQSELNTRKIEALRLSQTGR